MKKTFIIISLLWIAGPAFSQTQIATTNHSTATYSHNQRKIVRDWQENIYVVFTDILDDNIVIMGVQYDQLSDSWSDPFLITEGNSPTLAIDQNDKILLVYLTNDPEPVIQYSSSTDFNNWTEPVMISFEEYTADMPVADVDSLNVLNVLWRDCQDGWWDSRLCYAGVIADTLVQNKVVLERENIWDLAIANHLQYASNDLYFAVEFFMDTIQFFRSTNHTDSVELLYQQTGMFPGITFNYNYSYGWEEGNNVRFLMKHSNHLFEVEYGFMGTNTFIENQLPYEGDFICIDNLAPPIGYSFLFIEDDMLKHGFSYGSLWDWSTIMSSISSNHEISNPNIAYKHFNPLFVDFVWMESTSNEYKIMYMRDDKHQYMPGIHDDEAGKGFSLTGGPNPFSQSIHLNVVAEEARDKTPPSIEIFSVQGQLVTHLNSDREEFINTTGETRFLYEWDGTGSSGDRVKQGIYLVRCSYDRKRVVRKIVFEP